MHEKLTRAEEEAYAELAKAAQRVERLEARRRLRKTASGRKRKVAVKIATESEVRHDV